MKTALILLLLCIALAAPAQAPAAALQQEQDLTGPPAQAPTAALQQAQDIIDQIGQALAPDPRLALYVVHAALHGDTLVVSGETSVAAAHDSLQAQLGRMQCSPRRCSVALLPACAPGSRCAGIVTVSTALLRRGPSEKEEIINQGLLGDALTILRDASYFHLVQLADGYIGYMDGGSVAAMSRDELATWQQRPKVIYWKKWGEIHSARKAESYPVSDIVLGASVAVVKKEGKWLRVALPDGREGYVLRKEVMDAADFARQPKPRPKELAETARQFLGYPYFWGGLSTKGFDCSGLTRTVYKLHGIQLPRDANMQVHAGQPVRYDSTYAALQPGDLLFFGRNIEHITHVGMYLGEGKFIHAGDLVLINSLRPRDPDFNPRRARDLRAVRRIL
ncbi:MAG TPA: C40 family peptidase [bacterium]|nr:C40 family peptidase [bacterium]HPR88445.1 C40 family peptidase [bacterium]